MGVGINFGIVSFRSLRTVPISFPGNILVPICTVVPPTDILLYTLFCKNVYFCGRGGNESGCS